MTWAERSTEVVRLAPRLTPLQAYVRALGDLVADAREELTPEQYSWFIAVACELVGIEAARLFVGEALRATRGESEAA